MGRTNKTPMLCGSETLAPEGEFRLAKTIFDLQNPREPPVVGTDFLLSLSFAPDLPCKTNLGSESSSGLKRESSGTFSRKQWLLPLSYETAVS